MKGKNDSEETSPEAVKSLFPSFLHCPNVYILCTKEAKRGGTCHLISINILSVDPQEDGNGRETTQSSLFLSLLLSSLFLSSSLL